jgi:hypothetical protein
MTISSSRLLREMPLYLRRLAALFFAACLGGCGRNDIQIYRVAKETSTDQAAPPTAENASAASQLSAPLQWKLPPGWKEVPPGQMRVASFVVEGKDGHQADVSIVPLPGLAGDDLANVNRWRGQLSQPAITEEEMAKSAQAVQMAGDSAKLFDEGGTLPDSGAKARILAAVLRREGVAWFFKMTGDDSLVAEQKSAFIGFLRSIQFALSSAASQLPRDHPPLTDSGAPGGPAATGDSAGPVWQAPATWQPASPGPMLFAKFQIYGDGDAQAAVNISRLSQDGGGPLANVNRWRGQLGLAPFGGEDLAKAAGSLDVAGGKAMFMDMTGSDARTQQKARLIGAIVSRPGETWFYKLMGNQQLVQRESAAFTNFVQTVKYPNAP